MSSTDSHSQRSLASFRHGGLAVMPTDELLALQQSVHAALHSRMFILSIGREIQRYINGSTLWDHLVILCKNRTDTLAQKIMESNGNIELWEKPFGISGKYSPISALSLPKGQFYYRYQKPTWSGIIIPTHEISY